MKNIDLKAFVAGAIVATTPFVQALAQDNRFFVQIPDSKTGPNDYPIFSRPLPLPKDRENSDPEFLQKVPNGIWKSKIKPPTYFHKLGISGRPATTAKFRAGSQTKVAKVDGSLSFDMVENGKTTATVTYLYEQGQISKISVSGGSEAAGLYSVETLKTPAGNLPMDYRQFSNGTPLILFGGYRKITDKKEFEETQNKMLELLLSKPKELPIEEAYKLSASKDASIRGAGLSKAMQLWNSAVFMTSAFDRAGVEEERKTKEIKEFFRVHNQNRSDSSRDDTKIQDHEHGSGHRQAERNGEKATTEATTKDLWKP